MNQIDNTLKYMNQKVRCLEMVLYEYSKIKKLSK